MHSLRCKTLRLLLLLLLLLYLFLGKFIVPSVSGQCCPPTVSFTINIINGNKGIMLGGIIFGETVTHDDPLTATNNVFIFTVTHDTIVSYMYSWYYLAQQTNLSPYF